MWRAQGLFLVTIVLQSLSLKIANASPIDELQYLARRNVPNLTRSTSFDIDDNPDLIGYFEWLPSAAKLRSCDVAETLQEWSSRFRVFTRERRYLYQSEHDGPGIKANLTTTLPRNDPTSLTWPQCARSIEALSVYIQQNEFSEEFKFSIENRQTRTTLANGFVMKSSDSVSSLSTSECSTDGAELRSRTTPDDPESSDDPEPPPSRPSGPSAITETVDLVSLKMEADLIEDPHKKSKRLQVLLAMSNLSRQMKKKGAEQLFWSQASSILVKATIWPYTLEGTQFTYEQASMAMDELWKYLDETYGHGDYNMFTFVIKDLHEENPLTYAAGAVQLKYDKPTLVVESNATSILPIGTGVVESIPHVSIAVS